MSEQNKKDLEPSISEDQSLINSAEQLKSMLEDADLEAIQSDLRHIQDPRKLSLSWWERLLAFFTGPVRKSPIPYDWEPSRLANIILASPEDEWPQIIDVMYRGRPDIALPRVAATFRHLSAFPLGAAKKARCALFAHYPFEENPHYETLLIQEMYVENQEDREELYACYMHLPELRRLSLVRLLDDEQLECLQPGILQILETIDRSTLKRWLRRLGPRQIDQFLDRLTGLWRQHRELLQGVLTALPDDSLDHFLETAQKRYRIATISASGSYTDNVHDLAFKVMGEQVLTRLGQGKLGHNSALSLLGKIPIEYLERSLAVGSRESKGLEGELEALRRRLQQGDYSVKKLDAQTLDERLKAMQMRVELPPPLEPENDS